MALPASEQKWADENGGVVREEGPDANGITTYHTANGSYVNIRANGTPAMRGAAPSTGTNAQPAAPAASTPAPSGGGGMNQQQIEAWITAQGGPGAVQYSSEKKRVPNPAFPMTLPNGENNPQYQPGQPATIETASEMWINSKTGAKLHVSKKDDGSFDVIENQGADPNKPAAGNDGPPGGKPYIDEEGPNGRRLGWNPATKQYDRDLGSSPSAQAAAAATPKEEVNPSDPTRLRKPDGKGGWVDAGPNAAGVQAAADRNKPTTTIKEDASGRLVSIQTFPDGRTPVITPLGVQGTPQQVKGPDGNTYERQPDGSYAPARGIPTDTKDDFPAEPADAPALNLTPGQVAQGLQKYSSYLAAQVKLHRDTGGKQGISPQNASKLMDNRIKLAESAGRESTNLASQQQGIVNSQVNQRGQTLGETASRRGDANTAYNNNLARFVPNMTMMGAGGGQLVANALSESLANNQAYVGQWGGFRESPEIQTPGFLQQIRDASMAGINTAASGGPVLTGAAGAPPVPAVAPPPPPSGADVAAQSAASQAQTAAAFGAATAPPAPQTPPPPPPAVNPVGGQPITVPAQPGASESGSIPPAINPVTGEPTGLSPLAGASDPPPSTYAKPDAPTFLPTPPPQVAPYQDDQRGPGYGAQIQTTVIGEPMPTTELPLPPINTLPGQPGTPQIGPDPSLAVPQGQMAPGMMPSFLSQARFGTAYDPRQRAAMLGISPDILELALAG